ncbi:gluconate 2-dehydrogenase subunit 3-like protein [Georgenia soli]|uniref:Gluconate 2-dehydrogenase subunit 3-like protein n=1 Tax=Georgenia soli TaxID=638953 RepID=A0A2A9EP35_9MICO|nr:gluconate 2-dehydrogenase subunit 3 family protein [Georgenia soli]PFG40022.1 gluconate 2-dehydrogenase subunit 3-like protein [Georgenia soli]
MSRLPLAPDDGGGRFPGFDTLSQSRHWDAATERLVRSRLEPPGPLRFFTADQARTARALCDQLLGQRGEPRVPVEIMVDARLAAGQTDGWHYDDMPEDGAAWRRTLAHLDEDAGHLAGSAGQRFADLPPAHQEQVLATVLDLEGERWHGMVALHVWSLWTRYACTAFYSHPWAWDEIGFGGPAYPRGYKNLGLDAREPFEVADARPSDPTRRAAHSGEPAGSEGAPVSGGAT